jgi:dihydroflavonol-4-reductase
MKIFLTGSTGFVGSHVARAYAAEGAELRLLTRATSKLAAIEGLAADVVVGDLRQPESLRTALHGCDALVHVAADYRLWVRDPQEMYAANVDGTRELLRIAREEGVAKVVYTSSVATMGFKTDGTIVDELTPVSLGDMIGHYKRSKFLAEQEAIAAARSGQHVMVLNPTTPIGPGDAKPTPTGRIVVDFLNRKFPAYVDTGLNLVDVAEVARMHVAALERGTPGERYILGGENLTLKQILDRMSAITGLPSPTMKVPHAVALAFAFFDENITGKVRGKEPRATVEAVRMGRKVMFASSAKAERDLGFRVLPIYNAMRAAIEWFIAHGYAPPLPESSCRGRGPLRAGILAALPGELRPLVRRWQAGVVKDGTRTWTRHRRRPYVDRGLCGDGRRRCAARACRG